MRAVLGSCNYGTAVDVWAIATTIAEFFMQVRTRVPQLQRCPIDGGPWGRGHPILQMAAVHISCCASLPTVNTLHEPLAPSHFVAAQMAVLQDFQRGGLGTNGPAFLAIAAGRGDGRKDADLEEVGTTVYEPVHGLMMMA